MSHEFAETDCRITRRHMLKIVVVGGFVLVCTLPDEDESEAAATWERAGTVSQFQVGVPKRVVLPKRQVIFVLRQDKNRWLAVSALCTHKGGEVRWEPARKRFFCPLHGATFDREGRNPQGPARRPLPTFPVQAKGSLVAVDVANAGVAVPGRPSRKKDREEEEEEHEHGRKHDRHREHDDD